MYGEPAFPTPTTTATYIPLHHEPAPTMRETMLHHYDDDDSDEEDADDYMHYSPMPSCQHACVRERERACVYVCADADALETRAHTEHNSTRRAHIAHTRRHTRTHDARRTEMRTLTQMMNN